LRSVSLKKKNDFDRVFDKGRRVHGGLLTAIITKCDGQPKLGMIVNSKFGGAVARNKVKRMIREAFSAVAAKLEDKPEIVIIPKGLAGKAKTQEILKDLSSILLRAGIK
jgi:ribonuclease P protein component